MKKRTAISLFSGAGGMDLGLINSGFEIIWANDIDKDATITYSNNIGDIQLGDITKINSKDIPGDPYNVDLVVGGFPCQGFSINNNSRHLKDERNFLYLEMLRIIKDKQPKFFIAENVKGILNLGNGHAIDMIMNDFNNLGYNTDFRLLNAADYGVPQLRERVIIIGNRLGLENPYPKQTHADLYPGEDNYDKLDPKYMSISMFDDTKKLKPYKTVEETIDFLRNIEIQNGKSSDFILVNDEKIYNHIANTKVKDKFWGRKYDVCQEDICDYLRYWRDKSDWSVKKIDEHFGYRHTAGHWFRKDNNSGSIPKPSDWWELKKILGFDDKYDKEVTTFVEKDIKFEQSLRITNWNRASATITATQPEIHIDKERRLSARECALIQTFPNDFVFYGSLSSMYRQIGNAVPVLLAEKLGNEIMDSLDKFEEEEIVI